MTEKLNSMIADAVKKYISQGLIPDSDTIHFLKSAYDLAEDDEIASFIRNGDDCSALLDMISYPSDSFREAIEILIPGEGIPDDGIKNIEDLVNSGSEDVNFILIKKSRIFLQSDDSLYCNKKIIQRLNLNIKFDYINSVNEKSDDFRIFTARAALRKKKFIPSEDNSLFISDLILNYEYQKIKSKEEFLELINVSADLLNGTDKKAMDILAGKKYFYENAISEADEFARMLKTYSMEFIMLKRIQPPLIPADEARSMVRIIDRITSVVYGMIIPSAQNIILEN